MKSKIVAGSVIASILIIGFSVGYIVHRIQRQNLLSEAQRLFNQGDYQELVDKLKPSLQDDAPAADERILAAESYYRMRRYDEAQKVLDPLIRAGQEDARALALSGWLWVKEKSPLQAQVRFEKAANMGLEAEAEGGLGAVSLLKSENYRSSFLNVAISHLKKSITLDPNNPKVYLVFAELRRVQHEFDEAISLTQKAIRLAPHWSEPHGMLGRIYLLQDKHEDAEQAFKESQRWGGSEEETKYYLALSVYYQDRVDEALSLLEELIQDGQEMVKEALVDAAKIAWLMDEKKAIDYLQRAWAMKPDPQTGLQLFEIYSRLDRREEGAALLKELLTDWPFLSLAQLEMGHILVKQNEINRAYSSYQNVLEQDVRNFWANYNLGYLVPQRSDFNQAPDFFEAAVREYEDFFPAQVNMILGKLAVDRVMELEDQINDLLERYPQNSYLLLCRALERFASGDSGSALEYLERSLGAGQNQAVSFVIRGEILLRLFQFEDALASFEEAHRLDDANIRALLGKAHASYRLGDFSVSENVYEELFNKLSSLTLEQQVEVQNGLALIALERGDYQKSIEIWDKLGRDNQELARQLSAVNKGLIEEENPNPAAIEDLKTAAMSRNVLPETFYNLAVFYLTLGKDALSLDAYETLTRRFPGYLPGLYNLANLYGIEGRRGDAIAYYDRAAAVAPDRADILNNQAAIYAFTGQYERAGERLNEAEENDSNFPEIRYNKILLALTEGDVEEAPRLLSEFAGAGASSPLVGMAKGLVRAGEGRWEEAESAFSQAAQIDSQNAFTYINQGVSLAKLGRYPESQAALQKAVQCDPSLGEARRALGILYCQMGLFDLAEKELENALQLNPSQADLVEILTQIKKWMEEIKPSNP
ncbi:MAG: tetratricopeptide repeat protein [Candidatus Omnitrophica bacterium]|nr:tetratricopeptide repeat protein [Candidatus Omnitrophota bacterium]